jgi:hypothetical protein
MSTRDRVSMPPRLDLSPALLALLASQDGVISSDQLAAHGLDPGAVYRRVRSGRWQRLLPTVILTVSGQPTRRQLVIAAWLWGGPNAAVDGADACVWHGVRGPLPPSHPVHVVTPFGDSARSRDFVVVRRSVAPIDVAGRGAVPYVPAATALVVAARNAASRRDAVSLLATGLQKGAVTFTELRDARESIGDKWCRSVDAALLAVGVGLRSPAEKDAHDLFLSSRILPEPQWNQWLDLGDGGCPICADALWEGAGMINEVLGKKWHAFGEQFESTEARRARIVATGLVVQGCTAIQLRQSKAVVLDKLERTYLLNAGRGMPSGVRLIDPPRPIAC